MNKKYSGGTVFGAFALGVWSGIAGLFFIVGVAANNGACFWLSIAMILIGGFVVVMALSPRTTYVYVQQPEHREYRS